MAGPTVKWSWQAERADSNAARTDFSHPASELSAETDAVGDEDGGDEAPVWRRRATQTAGARYVRLIFRKRIQWKY